MRALIEAEAKNTCGEYPVATVVYYGPSDTDISQVIVSILQDENTPAEAIYEWRADTDINKHAEIAKEISAFITTSGARSVAIVDEVIGDAYQRSIDYPVTQTFNQ